MSGSGDSLRTALGSGWIQQSSSDSGETVVPYEGNAGLPESEYITEVSDSDIGADASNIIYSSRIVQPIIQYPVRIYGNSDIIKSDEHWKSIMNGGEYGEQNYNGIYSGEEFSNHWFNYSLPFTVLEARESGRTLKKIEKINVSYDYNNYLPAYEKYVSGLSSELLIPNMYVLQSISEMDETTMSLEQANVYYDRDIINYVSRESMVPPDLWASLFKTENDIEAISEMSPHEKRIVSQDQHRRLREYLDKMYPRHAISSSTVTAIATKMQNVLFDDMTIQKEFVDTMNNRARMPYYAKIEFEASPGGSLVEAIKQNDFSSKFLVSLKDTFGKEPRVNTIENLSFTAQETTHLNLSQELNTISTIQFRSVDYGDLINNARLNYAQLSNDYCFIGRQDTLARLSAQDSKGIYRYQNTLFSTKTLANYLDAVDEPLYLKSISEPHKKQNTPTAHPVETMAYRIEKIGGPPTGDSNTQNVIQNFWFINTTNLYDRTTDLLQVKDFQFMDSQIKYGEEYTYNVYAYVLVMGSRYQASDLRVTKTIANLSDSEYCLQFYDPETGDTKDRLFIDSSTSLSTRNELATDAQIASTSKYVADYNMTIQPSLKLMEVPLTTKTLRVLDNPANTVTALPFHIEDASQRIGFDIEYRAFEEKAFPKIVDLEDETYKLDYLNSNNLLEDTELMNESVSRPRYLEVFRTDKMPRSYTNFDGELQQTIDLKMINDKQTYKDYIFYDKINTNKKYYYMFRFLNEHRDPSRPSLIYEAELVNDGGYTYSIFDTLFIEDLEKEKFVKTSISFKKLINLVPNIQHLLLDDSAADYAAEAKQQIVNIKVGSVDSLIWNKRFKMRLTSKKTGKKIDLNITYDLRSE